MDNSSLTELHRSIHLCRKCAIASEFWRAERILEAPESKLMVIGQALANKTQRRSGLPYRYPDGTLSRAGQRLESFLKDIGFSLASVYCTDVVKCYPGKKGKGDREPSTEEIANCAEWLIKEIQAFQPEVVVTLGKIAKRVYTSAANEAEYLSLTFSIPHPAYFRWKPAECNEIYKRTAVEIREIMS